MKVPPNPHECCSRTNPQKISCQNDARLYDKGTKLDFSRINRQSKRSFRLVAEERRQRSACDSGSVVYRSFCRSRLRKPLIRNGQPTRLQVPVVGSAPGG